MIGTVLDMWVRSWDTISRQKIGRRFRRRRDAHASMVNPIARHPSIWNGATTMMQKVGPYSLLLFCVLSGHGYDSVSCSAGGEDRAVFDEVLFSPSGERLLFTANIGESPDIYVADSDGKNVQRLTRSDNREVDITWSPDGKHVAFVAKTKHDKDIIYIMREDGRDCRQFTEPGPFYARPRWSPDGGRIAYVTLSEGKRDRSIEFMCVEILKDNGLNEGVMTRSPLGAGRFSWSPDGTAIAYTRWTGKGSEVEVMSTDGTNVKRLTSLDEFIWDPVWSPDGSKIIFPCQIKHESILFQIDVKNGDLRRLVVRDDFLNIIHPSYSADGKKIFFCCAECPSREVFHCICAVDNDGQIILVARRKGYHFGEPAYSKSSIAFRIYEHGNDAIYIMSPDGTNVEKIVDSQRLGGL